MEKEGHRGREMITNKWNATLDLMVPKKWAFFIKAFWWLKAWGREAARVWGIE
jgi:hypothetical protein